MAVATVALVSSTGTVASNHLSAHTSELKWLIAARGWQQRDKKPMGCEAQLAAQLWAFSMISYKPSKLGQTDLLFGLWSKFISRHAVKQVSGSSGYDFCGSTHRQTYRQLLTSYTISSVSWAKKRSRNVPAEKLNAIDRCKYDQTCTHQRQPLRKKRTQTTLTTAMK